MKRLIALISLIFLSAMPASADQMKLAVTTSFHNSGLAAILLPEIRKDLNLDVQLLVVGTGQALRLGRGGDVDAVLVHSRPDEDRFVADGFATHRREIMYNDFVLIGPEGDPAGIASAKTAAEAMQKIAAARVPFVSRGDDSGTNKRELSLWKAAGISKAERNAPWYRAAGAGMGATLNIATGMQAYTLSDRASWLNFGNRDGMKLLFSGDPALFNQYAYLPVNPARYPNVNHKAAKALEDWLTSEKAQKMIGAYEIHGQKLFVPNARPMG